MNAYIGEENADAVIKKLLDTIKAKIVESKGPDAGRDAEIYRVHDKGDEIGIVAPGFTATELESVLNEAKKEMDTFAEKNQ